MDASTWTRKCEQGRRRCQGCDAWVCPQQGSRGGASQCWAAGAGKSEGWSVRWCKRWSGRRTGAGEGGAAFPWHWRCRSPSQPLRPEGVAATLEAGGGSGGGTACREGGRERGRRRFRRRRGGEGGRFEVAGWFWSSGRDKGGLVCQGRDGSRGWTRGR